jgi:phosphopantetheinyl transferase (holo-ACP synthase)
LGVKIPDFLHSFRRKKYLKKQQKKLTPRFASKASLAKVIQHRPEDNTTFDKTVVVKNVPEALDLFGITKVPKELNTVTF